MDASFFQPPEVLFADEFCRPSFQMGPYDNSAMARNFEITQAAEPLPEVDWPRYFGAGSHFTLTANGREAIALALADLAPRRRNPDCDNQRQQLHQQLCQLVALAE